MHGRKIISCNKQLYPLVLALPRATDRRYDNFFLFQIDGVREIFPASSSQCERQLFSLQD